MPEEEIEVEASLVFQRNLKIRLVSGEIWKGNLVVYESNDPYVLLIRYNNEFGEVLELDVFKDDLSQAMKHFLAGNSIRYPCVLIPNRIEESILQFIKLSKPPKVEDLVLWILSRTECIPGKDSTPSVFLLGGQVNYENIDHGRTRGEALLDELNNSFSHTKNVHATHATVKNFEESTRDHCLINKNLLDENETRRFYTTNMKENFEDIDNEFKKVDDLGTFEMTKKLLGKSKTLEKLRSNSVDRGTSKTVNAHTVNFSDEHWLIFNEIEMTRKKIKDKMETRRRLLEISKIRQEQVGKKNLLIRDNLKSLSEGNKFLYEAQEELKYLKRVEEDIDEDIKKKKILIKKNADLVKQTLAPNGYINRRGKSVKGPKIGEGPLKIEAISSLKDPDVEKAAKKYYWDSSGRKHVKDYNEDDEKSLVDLAMDAIRKAASNVATFKLDLRQIFNEFDTSGDGFLTIDEMAEAFLAIGIRLDIPTMKAIFNHFDPNGSGSVHYGEFVWAFYNRRNLLRQWKRKTEGMTEREIREKFHKYDKNGNGYLSKNEFTKCLKDFGMSLSEKEIDILIERFDVDGDNEIDYNEFKMFLDSEQQEINSPSSNTGGLPKPRTLTRSIRSRSASPAPPLPPSSSTINTSRVRHQQTLPSPRQHPTKNRDNPYSDSIIPPPIPLKNDQPYTNKQKEKIIEALSEETDVLWLSRMLAAQAEIEERLGRQYYGK